VEKASEAADRCPGGQLIRSVRRPGIACYEILYPGGTCLGAHAHEAAHFTLSMDGSCSESAGGRSFDCGPRAVVFHAAGEAHSLTVGGHALRSFRVEMQGGSAACGRSAGELETLLGGTRFLHAAGGPLASILAALYCELRCPDDCSALAVEGLLFQLIAAAARLSRETGCDRREPPWVKQTADLLHQRFRSRLTLEEISSAVGVSPARLSLAFRRAYHRTIAEEQRRLRVEFAAARLSEPQPSLAEIALDAGFSDQAHFCRAFKESTGMTPARYRAAMSM
jgi:AraC family transcriptional regulator